MTTKQLSGRGLSAASWYRATADRWVAVIAAIPGFDPHFLTGQAVMIDSRPYRVQAVETNAVPDATGRVFGLLVGAALT